MFALTADHLAVRDMAKSFADERIAPDALRWDETEHFPVDVLREAAALGMAAIYVGEQHGGSGMTRLDAALIFEALSTGCPSIASFLSIHNMVAWVIDGFGSPELKSRYLPRLANMELIASYCLTEPGAAPTPRRLPRAPGATATIMCSTASNSSSPAQGSATSISSWRAPARAARRDFRVPAREGAPGLSFGAIEKRWDGARSRRVR